MGERDKEAERKGRERTKQEWEGDGRTERSENERGHKRIIRQGGEGKTSEKESNRGRKVRQRHKTWWVRDN